MEYGNAYAICVNGLWHSAMKAADLGDFLDVQIGIYQSMQAKKSAVDAIKVQHKMSEFIGEDRPRFDINVGIDK